MRHLHLVGTVVVALLLVATPLVLSNDFYLKVLFLVGVYYLAAAGLNVLVGYTGQKSLGHAGLFAVGAYTAALLTAKAGWNPWLAFAASGIVAGFFGILIALPAVRVKGPALAMVTIGFGIVMEKVVTEWQEVFGGQAGIYGVVPPSISGSPLTARQWFWFVAALAFVVHLMARALLRGKYGRGFAAVNAGEIAAESVGLNVYRYKVLAFVISAVTCGFAGALIAQQNQYINSDFITFNLSIFFLLIVLFGGGSLYGPLLGAVVLTFLDAWLAQWPNLQHFAYGTLLLFALYAMPDGLAGAFASIGRRFIARVRVRETLPYSPGDWTLSRNHQIEKDQPLLESFSINKAFGGVTAANSIDIRLKAGHIHSLIGPNGAGKTTLINMLSGIIAADSGRIVFDGIDITNLTAHRVCRLGIGRTFQNLKLFEAMSVVDNVKVGLQSRLPVGFLPCLLGLRAAAREEREAREEALRILAFAGLLGRANDRAGSLPYGLQRRLELARALATQPKLLLLDEPAAGLNPQETQELIDLIRIIRDKGITVLLIEHHMDLVMAISDHVIVLDYGEKIAEGTPADIQGNPRVIVAYLGTEDEDPGSESLSTGVAGEPTTNAT